MSYAYDAAGRRVSMTDATGTTRYAYDAAGRLLTTTDPEGEITAAAYDAAGQRTSLHYPSGLQVSFGYDLNGRLISLNDSRAGTAAYALDPDGRLLTEELPGRNARRYRYDHGLLSRFLVIRDGHPVARAAFTHDPDGRVASQRGDGELKRYEYDPAGQLTGITREQMPPHRAAAERDPEAGCEELPACTDLRRGRQPHPAAAGRVETHYRYDAASQLLGSDEDGRRTEYRYDTSGRLTEQVEGERRRVIGYNGLGLPSGVTISEPGREERRQPVFDGNSLLASLALTFTNLRDDEQRGAAVRYRWSTDSIPQILTQTASPRLDDAERDRPGRLDADFAYGYGRTFASSPHAAATFHADAFSSAIRTRRTLGPGPQADRYDTFGAPLDPLDHEHEHGHDHDHEHSLAMTMSTDTSLATSVSWHEPGHEREPGTSLATSMSMSTSRAPTACPSCPGSATGASWPSAR